MTTLFGTILAAALMAQFQGVRFKAPSSTTKASPSPTPRSSFMPPHHGEATRNRWRYGPRLMIKAGSVSRLPGWQGFRILDSKVWAYRPGSAITAVPCRRQPLVLVLRKPEPRIVKIEGPGGGPVDQGADYRPDEP